MATLLLWQFDKFLKKNRLAGYNRVIINNVNAIVKEQEDEKKIQESLIKV